MPLLLPRTPGGAAAAQELQRRRQEATANAISKSSKTALSSDEFLTRKDIRQQIQKLEDYVNAQADIDPDYQIPGAVGWRIVVLVLQPPEHTAGGLTLPEDVTEAYAHKSMQGIVLQLGEDAYLDEKRFSAPWCKVGDRIVFKRYDASPFELANGQKLGILNDTQPIGVIDRNWLDEYLTVKGD